MLLLKPNSGRKSGGGGKNQPDSVLKNITPTQAYDDYVKNYFDRKKADIERQLGRKLTEQDMQILEKAIYNLTSSPDTHIGIRLPIDKLDSILNDGRFKSQFETGTSKGILATDKRANYENMAMSYSKTLPPEQRPIYGMLFNYKKLSEVDVSHGDGSHYGKVIAIMKPDVKRYATFTGGDSLDCRGQITPSPLLRPSRYSLDMRNSYVAINAALTSQRLTLLETSAHYTEAQIHGGHAKVNNIQHLIFARGTPTSQIPTARLKQLGISWSMEGENKIN